MSDLDLSRRPGLPDALRVLLDAYPRSAWTADPGFNELIRFWLERHAMFRDLLQRLIESHQQRLDDQGDPRQFRAGLSRYGGFFLEQLQHHHRIEDAHYFPPLSRRDTRLARGFQILDADHHALDGQLASFVEGANRVLQARDDGVELKDETGRFLGELERLEQLLDRHLIDEEELIVPVILKYGADGLV